MLDSVMVLLLQHLHTIYKHSSLRFHCWIFHMFGRREKNKNKDGYYTTQLIPRTVYFSSQSGESKQSEGHVVDGKACGEVNFA